MAVKGYSAFPKAPALLEPRHQICLVSYLGHSLEGCLTSQQRCSRCIQQSQPTGPITDITALAGGLSLEFDWQQVSSSLQGSSQYSDRSQQCCNLDVLDSFFDLQFSSLLSKPSRGVPRAPYIIAITVTLILHSTVSFLARSKYLSIFLLFLFFFLCG